MIKSSLPQTEYITTHAKLQQFQQRVKTFANNQRL